MNLLIGAADKYTSKQLVPWVKTFREHNTIDDIVLICYRVDADIVDVLAPYNVKCVQADIDDEGNSIKFDVGPANTPVHALRFFHIYQYLLSEPNTYKHVLTTDTRDVIFQDNPFNILALEYNSLIFSCEDLKYRHEDWGAHNILSGFGQAIWSLAHDWDIYNVGVIAGHAEHIKSLCYLLYTMTKGRYIPSDQSAFNVLIHTMPLGDVWFSSHNDGWAAQIGTTLDPQKSHYIPNLLATPPVIDNGIVMCPRMKRPFNIVHQWDRHPELNRKYSTYVV